MLGILRYNSRMEGVFALFKHRHNLLLVYCATLFLSFHYFSTVYINSSLLSQLVSDRVVSVLFIVGALATLGVLTVFAPLARRFGTNRLCFSLATVEGAAVYGLATATDPSAILFFFVLHQAVPPLLLACLDVFLERTSTSESRTGGTRGIFLTITNVALICSPLMVTFLVRDENFSPMYLLSALSLVPFLVIISFMHTTSEPRRIPPLHHIFQTFVVKKDTRNVFVANLLLQIFYAWMVVYTPLYLQSIGMPWHDIGIVFAIMLIPFVLFELPLGMIADRRTGEKEFMIGGFVILAGATALFSFVTVSTIAIWAAILFVSRVGASFVEIMTESYFFKHVSGTDTDLISVFRMTRPISFIIGPAIGIAVLPLFSLQYAFVAFAAILFAGIFFAATIQDTR